MQELEMEVFRTGDYGERGTFGEEDLEQIAEDYDPSVHEAPVTIDHAQNGPAFGWVEKLYRKGDRLVARLRDMNGKFLDMVKSGGFKKRSIELYKKFERTGRPYLRALSFLGAKPPEVKGLADVSFADQDADFVSVEFCESNNPQSETTEQKTIRELIEEKRDVETRLHVFEEERKRDDLAVFCEDLKLKGKFLPAWEEMGIMGFMSLLDESETIEFGEDSEGTSLEWFKSFLSSMPEIVAMGELGAESRNGYVNLDSVPTGTRNLPVSPESIELHKRVVMFQESHEGVSYAEALKCVVSS